MNIILKRTMLLPTTLFLVLSKVHQSLQQDISTQISSASYKKIDVDYDSWMKASLNETKIFLIDSRQRYRVIQPKSHNLAPTYFLYTWSKTSYSASSFLPFKLSQCGVSEVDRGKRVAKEPPKDDMKQSFLQPTKYPKAYP